MITVSFGEHKNWENLFSAAWQMHKSNIKKASLKLNPEDVFYVDEAFDDDIYAWDTMFMMMFDKYGYTEFPTLQSLDNFYYHQTDRAGHPGNGFIPREIQESTGTPVFAYDNLRSGTNPPLWGWAEWEQYLIHGDKARFLKIINGKTILQRLDEHFQFIRANRIHPVSGLYVTAGDGNGMDNTPNQDVPYYAPIAIEDRQTYSDLSLQMYQFASCIKNIADEVGNMPLSEKYESKMQGLREKIQDKLWNESLSFFFNLNPAGTEHTGVVTPAGLWALAAGVATPQQAELMIRNYILNSEQMFRPRGLSTVAYDHAAFKPAGGYWNSAFWAPASYMCIKGLQEYGYDKLAFREAVRHVDTLSRIYENGAYDRNHQLLHTLWECYSSEYELPGSTESDAIPARANFVGWTGVLAIGCLLEDIIGIRPDAPGNALYWTLHLTEEYQIDNLWMAGKTPKGNTISLCSGKRLTADSPVTVHVTADEPFLLHVKNNGQTYSFPVSSGVNRFRIDGADSGKGTLLSGRLETIASLDKKIPENYVFFQKESDRLVTDGLQNQCGHNHSGKIFNVNTVGYRNAVMRICPSLFHIFGGDCREYVKQGIRDGFMVMAEAGIRTQTLKLVLGVKNATARISTKLSDGSAGIYEEVVSAGVREKEFIAEIFFRAAAGDHYLMCEYIMTDGLYGGEISLKAILLNDAEEK